MTQAWSIEELIEVLEKNRATGQDSDPTLMTGPDYADLAGISEKTAQRRLKHLSTLGLVSPGQKIIRENVHGVKTKKWGWRLNVEEILKWQTSSDKD